MGKGKRTTASKQERALEARLAELRSLQAQAAASALRAFEGAKQSRRTDGWLTSGRGANAELKPVLDRLIQRHQDLVDSNPWCGRAVEVICSNWIGSGIMGSAPAGAFGTFNTAFTRWAESTKCDYFGKTNFYGLQDLWTRTNVVRGSVLIRQRIAPELRAKGLIPLQLQVMEPDWLDKTRDDGTGRIFGGKQYTAEGKLEGYYLYLSHPGEASGMAGVQSQFVPASEILHVYDLRRPGQYTGVPFGVTAFLRARDLDEYLSTDILKQKIAACFVGFRTKQQVGPPTTIGIGETAATSATSEVDTFEPGAIEELAPGESITFATPPKADGGADLVKTNLHAIAIAYGITYEALTGILSDVNFSSGRMGWLEFARNVERWRWNITVPQALDPIGEWFSELTRIERIKTPAKMSWTPPRRELINPKEEISWMREALEGGMMTLSYIQKSFGFVPSELIKEFAEDLKALDEAGLSMYSYLLKGQGNGIKPPLTPANPASEQPLTTTSPEQPA